MIKWEYKSAFRDSGTEESFLNEFGQQGWELVSFVQGNFGVSYIFKRIKETDDQVSIS